MDLDYWKETLTIAQKDKKIIQQRSSNIYFMTKSYTYTLSMNYTRIKIYIYTFKMWRQRKSVKKPKLQLLLALKK